MIARLFIAIGIFIGLGFGAYWAYDASRLYAFQAGYTGSYTYNLLFESVVWAIPVSILLGVLVGSFAKDGHDTHIDEQGKVLRHDETMFFQHWSHAIATLLLIVTGIGLGVLIFPRFFSNPQDVGFALNLHFIGVVLFLFTVFFHVTKNILTGEIKENMPAAHDIPEAIGHYKAMLGFGKQPEEGKYLASERLSYPVWGIFVAGIILSGLIKVSAYIWNMPEVLMTVATLVHGVCTVAIVLVLIVHVFLGAIIPPSWPLIKSMITGYVTEDYVKAHHVKWYKQIKDNKKSKTEESIEAIPNKEETTSI
jgi:formate dehydrogenase gamma subunit